LFVFRVSCLSELGETKALLAPLLWARFFILQVAAAFWLLLLLFFDRSRHPAVVLGVGGRMEQCSTRGRNARDVAVGGHGDHHARVGAACGSCRTPGTHAIQSISNLSGIHDGTRQDVKLPRFFQSSSMLMTRLASHYTPSVL
jgi:hypothetical protein